MTSTSSCIFLRARMWNKVHNDHPLVIERHTNPGSNIYYKRSRSRLDDIFDWVSTQNDANCTETANIIPKRNILAPKLLARRALYSPKVSRVFQLYFNCFWGSRVGCMLIWARWEGYFALEVALQCRGCVTVRAKKVIPLYFQVGLVLHKYQRLLRSTGNLYSRFFLWTDFFF